MTTRYRITSRTRFTIFVAIMIILLTSVANFALGLSTADSYTIMEYMDIEISSGDTLWSIAGTYMSDEYSDIREAVYKLCKINDITADQLYVGMTIKVPICN